MVSLAGRRALVTGAAGGLGRAICESLAKAGVVVALCDVRPEVAEIARELNGAGRALGIVADVAREADVVRLIDTVMTEFGRIDVLIECAAVWRCTPVTDGFEKARGDYHAIMDTNLRGTLMVARACVPQMVAAGGGDIVLIGSHDVLPARDASTNVGDADLYTASTWALNGFVQAWALVLARRKVRVNALCIGPTDTPMLRAQIAAGRSLHGVPLDPAAIAAQLIALLEEGPGGRTGENVGFRPGDPVELGPRKPAHRTVTG
jgi:NAD(P)-dependent dehydrogenase (short-subunit alcohol dehydrogenase family)